MSTRRVTAVLILLATVLALPPSANGASWRSQLNSQQAKLDAECEAARERILRVERAQYVEECVTKKFPRPDRAGCERFYADHGNATAGGRAPLYMDLPECVKAHEFRQSRSR